MQVGIQLYLLQTTIICMCVFQCLIDIFPGFVKIIFVFIKQQSNILQCQTLIVSRHYIANGSKQQITPLLLPQFIVAACTTERMPPCRTCGFPVRSFALPYSMKR